MRKAKKILSLVIVFALLTAVLVFTGSAVGDNTLFDTGSTYTVEENYTADEVSDGKAGTLITSSVSDQALRFKNPMSGSFEVEFRPLNSGTGEKEFSSINFFIRSRDSRYGLELQYIDGDLNSSVAKEKPKYAVRLDLPERIYGWSSTSRAATAGSRNDGEIARMGFDAETKEVYCYNNGVKSILVDLDDPLSISGRSFNTTAIFKGFDSYDVEITVSGITGGETSFIIYSVNGQNLSGDNSAGPVLFGMPKIPNGVANEEYVISETDVKTYDFLDGYKDGFVGKITATSPSGSTETLVDNKFTPTEVGIYKLAFTPKDGEGLFGTTKTVQIDVLASKPEPTLDVSFPLANMSVAKDTAVSFPSATAESELDCYNDAIEPVLTITKAGQVVTSYSAKDYSEYTFAETGSYEVSISATDVSGKKVSESANITVSDDVPYFEFLSKIDSVQDVGTTLTIPDVRVSGGVVRSNIVFPDGRSVSTKCIDLDVLGVYKITYTATVGSSTYEYVKYFVADRSSASLLTSYSATKSSFATAPDYAAEEYVGVKITGSRSMSTARWANIINLNDNTADDKLIEFFVMPEEQGVKEYTEFQISLTDANDPTRKFTINYKEDKWAEDYKMDGSVCGNKDGIYTSVGSLRMSPYGAFNSKYWGWYPAIATCLYYDWESNTLYGSLANQNGGKTAIKTKIITLDDETKLGSGNGFPGFTTGEVYLDISFVTLNSSSPDMLIMNVDGQDLSTEYVVDNTAPYFCVDFDGNEEGDLPKGLINEDYPIYKAIARDTVDGLCDAPSIKIFYYGEDGTDVRTRLMHDVTETTFKPTQKGWYSIEYSAKDAHGNEGFKEIMVEIVDQIPEIHFVWDADMDATAVTGIDITVPDGEPSGGSGKLKQELSVTVDDELVELKGRTFTPLKSGDYEVKVTVSDYLGTKAYFIKNITISANPDPVLVEATVPYGVVVTPEAEVGTKKERGTTFAPWTAYDYSSGEQAVLDVTVKVKLKGADDSTAVELGDDLKWVPTEAGVYEVMFSAANLNGTTTVVKEVEAVDTTKGVGFMTKFFIKDGVDVTAPDNSTLLASATRDGAKMAFVNLLPADGFNFRFTVPGGKNGFDSVTLTVVDSVNPKEKLELTMIKEVNDGSDLKNNPYRESSTIYVNGIEKEILGSFHNINKTPFDINYDNDSFIITDNLGDTVTKVTDKLDGTEWTGFSSGKVYISFTFNGAGITESNSAIVVGNICGQAFSGTQSDRTRPSVVVPVAIPAEYGGKLIVPAATAYDVLSKLTEFKVTVKAPDGSVVKDVDGVKLDGVDATKEYQVDVTQYGNYDIKYYVEDSAENKTGRTGVPGYIVIVRDKVPPTLTVNGEVPLSINAESEITVPTATLTDNRVGGSATLYVWWVLPSGRMIKVGEDMKIAKEYTTIKGDYKLVYYGIDVDGYTVTQEFKVKVK